MKDFKPSAFGSQNHSIYPLVLEKIFENAAACKARVVKIINSLKDVINPKGKYLQGESVFSGIYRFYLSIFLF